MPLYLGTWTLLYQGNRGERRFKVYVSGRLAILTVLLLHGTSTFYLVGYNLIAHQKRAQTRTIHNKYRRKKNKCCFGECSSSGCCWRQRQLCADASLFIAICKTNMYMLTYICVYIYMVYVCIQYTYLHVSMHMCVRLQSTGVSFMAFMFVCRYAAGIDAAAD